MTHVDTDPTLDRSDDSEPNGHEILTVEETFQRYFPALVRYTTGFNVRDPEGTVMSVFEKALKQREKKGTGVKLHPGWYFWVAHNTALDEMRMSSHRKEKLVDLDPSIYTDTPDYASADALGDIEFDELMLHVNQILADKPPHWKAIIAKRALYNDSNYEISQDLGIPTSTVRTSLFRMKKVLQADEALRSATGRE